MIQYEETELSNGLKVFLHKDPHTPLAAFNLVYNVGSRDENENKTGFAHLFEHLMFGGSQHIPNYDEPLQKVGAENNAFTSTDITNYYITLPATNIETAFWLESDRMLSLSFDQKVLDTQKKVVIEEFKQRYLNQPYGDVWLKLRPLAYKVHPYKWATIGKEIAHIENAEMEDVRSFFFQHYRPNNAKLVVAGNFEMGQIEALAKKWFGDIPAGEIKAKNIQQEPYQTSERIEETSAKVPLNAIYKAYHMPGRFGNGFHAADLVSDILGRSKSSRLHAKLVKENPLFNNISSNITASIDPGLLLIQGNLNNGVDIHEANAAINELVADFVKEELDALELSKVKNQAEASAEFSEVELLNRAMNLAFAANAGDPELSNLDREKMKVVTADQVKTAAAEILTPNNCSTLLYHAG